MRSLIFVSGSPASCSNSIPSFCFGFSGIAPGFDPLVLFRVLRNRAWIRSFRFVSSSPESRLDSILSFCFGFSGITPGFNPFILFWVLRHRSQILSFFLISGSLASCPNSIPSFCFGFFGIVPGFDPFLLFQILQHRARILLSFSTSCSDFPHLPRHRVRASLIFFGTVSEFSSSSSTSCPSIAYLFWNHIRLLLSFPASCLDFPHLPRHRV